ncbi:hypothetical protein IFM89_007393 [Coptis chinensis]|uniref:Clp R domain-containing protein n=1 Tax=Coptis chinensis TaxID=261450 RepID=A0A835IKR0_9MAGN|nr:hypothetical protein IFM89_007393 [Coptis chinensis]
MEICSSSSTSSSSPSSSSSPLAIHSMDLLIHRPPLSLPTTCRYNYSPHKFTTTLFVHRPLRSSSSIFGLSISQTNTPTFRLPRKPRKISALFERFTERAIKAVIYSQRETKELGKQMVFTQHLLLGLILEDRDSSGFLGSGITIERAREVVREIWSDGIDVIDSGSSGSKGSTDIPFSISTKRVFDAAHEYSRSMGYNFIAPEHIAIGLFTVDDGSAARVLKRRLFLMISLVPDDSCSYDVVWEFMDNSRLGANLNQLASVAVSRLQGELAKDGRQPFSSPREALKNVTSGKAAIVSSSENTKEKSALSQFCVDLTARANEGFIDPVIGRENEVQRIVQILCRRTKNNPILLGEPGVGKTAIAEGLATRIADGDVPVFLLAKRIMSLDIGLLMAGARERGELESRITTLISEILREGNIILFIDEVHTLIGSGTVGKGNKGSGLDIANLLKPSLGRGKLQCIGSTTTDEHRTHFEKDKALARRFQPVFINEPSEEDAVKILLGLREKYEAHHKCKYTLEAINAAAYLSARYIPDRYLPDKAIDLIDEAGSRAHIDAFKRKKEKQTNILSKSPKDYWQEITAVQAMHDVVLANKMKYGESSSGKNEDTKFLSEPSASSASDDDKFTMVGPDDVAAVASLWSGIPIQQLTVDERLRLVGLDEQLKQRIVGQDDAVVAISRAVKRSRVGLKDPNRPTAAILFCGPTGVGKTELSKALAACYFGSEDAMLRLDMSEFMERHAVSKLIGSPPGYIGYGEGGTLTEAVRKRPFTLLLLDEIEKAHPDIFNLLLQVFEDGHLTDSQGRTVSFKNTLIIMTSNIGSTAIAKGSRSSIGFLLEGGSHHAPNPQLPISKSQSCTSVTLTDAYTLKFLTSGNTLGLSVLLKMLEILNMMLKEVKGRVMSLGVGLEVSEAMMDLLCKRGYDRSYGARPLRRAVTLLIEDVLSEALLVGDCKPGDVAIIDVDADGNPFVTTQSDQRSHLSDVPNMM